MSAGAVLIIRMRRIIKAFREAGATAPVTAVDPTDIGIKVSFLFQRLVQRGVLVAVDAQHYYLNEEAEARYRKRRLALAVAVILVGVAVFIFSLAMPHK